MNSEMNIHQRINAVMEECDYLQKKAAQQGKGIKYDEVIAMLRPLLIKHGIVMVTNQDSLTELSTVEGTKQRIYQGQYSLSLVNKDKPDDKVVHTAIAQGMDGGDKGPGKAHTYAMKTMLVKGFGLETGEDEESRSEKIERTKTISDDQYSELAKFCVAADGVEWSQTGLKLMAAYKISGIQNLPACKFSEALERAKKHASN